MNQDYIQSCLDFFKQNNVILYSTNSELKSVVIERWNRTLKEKMSLRETELKLQHIPFRWMHELPLIIEEYTNTIHSTTKLTPVEGSKPENEDNIRKIFNNFTKDDYKKSPKYKLNDKVRLLKAKGIFEKGYTSKWTEEIFTIAEVGPTTPVTYRVMDLNNEEIQGKFYEWELLRTKVI